MGSNRDFSVFVASMANVNLGLHTYGTVRCYIISIEKTQMDIKNTMMRNRQNRLLMMFQ